MRGAEERLRHNGTSRTNSPVTLAVEAIFENGVLKPVHPIGLAEHQKVHLIVETRSATPASTPLNWHWQESQAIEDGFPGAVADEVARQRSKD